MWYKDLVAITHMWDGDLSQSILIDFSWRNIALCDSISIKNNTTWVSNHYIMCTQWYITILTKSKAIRQLKTRAALIFILLLQSVADNWNLDFKLWPGDVTITMEIKKTMPKYSAFKRCLAFKRVSQRLNGCLKQAFKQKRLNGSV